MVPQFGIAKLVNITPISLWFMADITIIFMGVINQQTSLGGTILQAAVIDFWEKFWETYPAW